MLKVRGPARSISGDPSANCQVMAQVGRGENHTSQRLKQEKGEKEKEERNYFLFAVQYSGWVADVPSPPHWKQTYYSKTALVCTLATCFCLSHPEPEMGAPQLGIQLQGVLPISAEQHRFQGGKGARCQFVSFFVPKSWAWKRRLRT
ncbi:hypothetical protein NPIL_510421 [Nephila pilipes]|uniref:Uncharacterized protein n=1 Tax=Nephila pilipes TaxID=299642 RepID=A0A8X6UGW5_NEPPI|nr:hypothetical protein NPIL_510421 [Nephila pilipes]